MFGILIAATAAFLITLFTIAADRRRRAAGLPRTPFASRLTLTCGVLALVILGLLTAGSWLAPAAFQAIDRWAGWGFQATLMLGVVGAAVGGYLVRTRDRSWPSIAGLACGGLVSAFWLVFLLGEVLSPH